MAVFFAAAGLAGTVLFFFVGGILPEVLEATGGAVQPFMSLVMLLQRLGFSTT